MPAAKPTWVSQPFLGLWLDLPSWQGDNRSFSACNNVRIANGVVTSALMGWTLLPDFTLNGPVTLIADFPTNNNHHLVLGTPTDLYDWHNGDPVFLTPVYTAGTVDSDLTGNLILGTDTFWNTKMGTLGVRNNVMVGDQLYIGNSTQNDPAAVWVTVTAINSDTSLTVTPAVTPSLLNQTYTLRQLAQGDAQAYKWQFEVFPLAGPPINNDAIFITNGLDPVVTWDGVDLFAEYQAGMPFLARFMQRYKNMMIYGGLTQDGASLYTSIANSNNGLPLELAEGIANQYVASDGPYIINHLGVLGNNLMIYMGTIDSGSVVAATFVGFPTNFVFNEVIRGRGPIADNLVLEFPDRHEFLGQDGQYRYNGLYTQLMNTHVWRVVLQNFDRQRSARSLSNIVPQYGLAHIAIPLLTDDDPELSTAYVENYLEQPQQILFKPVTQRDFPFTAVGQLPMNADLEYWNLDPYTWDIDPFRWNDNQITGAYANQFAGDKDGNVYVMFTAETQAPSFALFSQRVVAGERSRGLVRRIYPFAEYSNAGYSLTVTLTLVDQLAGATAITDVKTMPLDYSSNRFTSHFRRGRSAAVQFGTAGPNQPWTLTGYDWDISSGGLR